MKLLSVADEGDHLRLDIAGQACRFHFLWLRDNCPECRSPNGQRLHESNAIDLDIRPRSFSHNDDELHIVWSDDTRSVYPLDFLMARAYDNVPEQLEGIVLWNREIGQRIGWHDYDKVRTNTGALKAWLEDVDIYGFGLLTNVPPVEETILDVVGLFGYVRETNYGRLFEIQAEENASNLAYTPVPLSVHTDNPYRDPCPTLQLIHCLRQADEGGVTALVDGFFAADMLRRQDPKAFALLSESDVVFQYESAEVFLDNTERIIALDAAGRPRKIHINNRSMAPLKLHFDLVLPFYRALFDFRNILESVESQFRFGLRGGDLMLFDNERILHGRVGESIGPRHLQGCYADRDGLRSTLRMLEKNGA